MEKSKLEYEYELYSIYDHGSYSLGKKIIN